MNATNPRLLLIDVESPDFSCDLHFLLEKESKSTSVKAYHRETCVSSQVLFHTYIFQIICYVDILNPNFVFGATDIEPWNEQLVSWRRTADSADCGARN